MSPPPTPPPETRPALAISILGGLVALKLALHALALTQYGYFRDELYYLACARRLAWGYVDHPPLSVAVLALWRAVFGDGLVSIRSVPVLCGVATLVFAALLTRELGGGRIAQGLCGLAVMAAPLYLVVNHFFSMNALDIAIWSAAVWLFARALRTAGTRDWVVLGVVLGLGLLNKLSVLWLGAGFFTALLLTSERRHLRTRGPWLAGGLAAFFLLPHVLWQVSNGWPTVTFMRNAAGEKMAHTPPLDFLLGQVEAMNPAAALLWVPGLVFALRGRAPRLRALGFVYLTVLAIVLLPGTSRAQYLSPAYPILFAAGGLAVEALRAPRPRRAVTFGLATLMVAVGALALPLVLPLLTPEALVRYQERVGAQPGTEEKKSVGPLSQHYADMFGWPELAAAVERAAATLTPEEHARAVVFAQNYGEAGALEHFGRGLPPVISGHNNYWLWGPVRGEASVAIIVGGDRDDNAAHFADLREVARTACTYCMPYEANLPIYVGRGMRATVGAAWPALQHYD